MNSPRPGDPWVDLVSRIALTQATVTALLEVFIDGAAPELAGAIVERIKVHHATATAGYPEVVKQDAAALLAGFLNQLAGQLPSLPAGERPKSN